MVDVISAALLLSALALAPFIGGGFGELAGGALQILVYGGIGCRLLWAKKDSDVLPRVAGMWFAAAFAVLVVGSTFTTHCAYFSLNQLLVIFACLGAFVLSSVLCREKRIATAAVWIVLISATLVSVFGIREYAFSVGGGANFWNAIFKPGEHVRIFGTFVNPNFFSGFLVISLPVALGVYLVTRKTPLVVLAGIGFVSGVLALMLTGAKFGIVASVASLGIFFLLAAFTKSLRRAKFARLLVICVVLIPLVALFSPVVTTRIRAAEAGGTQVHSTKFRIYTWHATFNMIKDYPILGGGPGNFAITYPRYTIAGPTKHAHSSYLQIAAECGLPALVALLLLLGAIAHKSCVGIIRGSVCSSDHMRDDGDEPSESIAWADLVPFSGWRIVNCALFAGLFASAIRSLVDSDWYVLGISLPFWIIAGVLVAQSSAVESRNKSLPSIFRWALAAVCAIAILLSISFGLGDFFASRARSISGTGHESVRRVVDFYKRAAAVCPLDPEYHRLLGVWLGLGEGDVETAKDEIDKSIRLAPNTSEGGWYGRALLDGCQQDWPDAIISLKTAKKFSPNSTQTLFRLAQAYGVVGDIRGRESTFRKLVNIETSPYEEIKGTPEIVDTTYAFARAYFGAKAIRQKQYCYAICQYQIAVDRLERWRESGKMREVQKVMGMVSDEDERVNLNLLRECYRGLAAAYIGQGDRHKAAAALEKAASLK